MYMYKCALIILPQAHARKKLEAEEEIRRVRASAVKVRVIYMGLYTCACKCKLYCTYVEERHYT